MIKHGVAALLILSVACVLLFLLWNAKPQPNAPHGALNSSQAQASRLAPNPKTERINNRAADNTRGPDADSAVPFPMLDAALEHATAGVRPPEGIQSRQIPEDNGLHWFLLAAELSPRIEDRWLWDTRDAIFATGWKEDPRIAEELEKFRPAFDAIRKGLEVGNVSFPPADLEEQMPYLAKWRELGRTMTLLAVMDASHGNYETAIEEFATVFDFANESSRNGFIIMHLVGYAVQNTAAEQLIKVLQSPDMPAAQYRSVLARLQDIHAKAPAIIEPLKAEVAFFSRWFEENAGMPDFQETYTRFIQSEASEKARKALETATPDQVRLMCRQFIDGASQAVPLFEAPIYQFDYAAFDKLTGLSVINEDALVNYRKFPEYEARARFLRSGPILVAAIEEFRREKGTCPDTLDALVPDLLPQLPNDPFSGKPFHYQSRFGNYRLYSVGPDMRDDGGAGNVWDFKNPDYIVTGTGPLR